MVPLEQQGKLQFVIFISDSEVCQDDLATQTSENEFV